MSRSFTAARLLLPVLLALQIAGCARQRIPDGPPPTYRMLADAYNTRVASLDRVWARSTVQLRYADRDGDWHKDQGEGHIQIVAPNSLALTVGKLGETYFHLGSNERQYFWFDLSDDRRASVGLHANAHHTAMRLGAIPVLPLDVLALLGMTLLPEGEFATSWTDKGAVEVVVPLRDGSMRLHLDASRFLPSRIEILASDGTLLVYSELSRYDVVPIVGDATRRPQLAGAIYIRSATDESWIRLGVYDPENSPRRPRPVVFDFERLRNAYGIESQAVEDLDADAIAAP